MHKSFIFIPLALITVLLMSCNSGQKNYTAYQCPMQCEGEKTYQKAGDCPVCGMELEGINAKK